MMKDVVKACHFNYMCIKHNDVALIHSCHSGSSP